MAEIIGSLVKFNQSKKSAAALNGNASTVHFTTDGDLVLNGKSYIHSVGNVYYDEEGQKWIIQGGALKQLAVEMGTLTNGLDGRIEALEHTVDGYTSEGGQPVPGVVDKIKTDSNAPAGSIGNTVYILNGAETVTGSVRNLIKTKIEGLDVDDTEVAGSVVVAVSEEDGKVSNVKKAVTVAETATTEGMEKTYAVKIGDHPVGKIDIPFCTSTLHQAKLSDMNATLATKDEGKIHKGDIIDGEIPGEPALVLSFRKGNGEFDMVKVDITEILVESEFKNGLDVNNHVVSIKLVPNNDYLKFGEAAEGVNKPLVANVVTLAEASSTNTGVADANDVKTAIDAIATFGEDGILDGGVLAEMDRVTSAALNDLNTRMGRNEDLATTEKTNLVGAINELKYDINTTTAGAVINVKQEKTVQEVSVVMSDVKNESGVTIGKEATVGVSKATYTPPTGSGEGLLSDGGLVDASVLNQFVINKIDNNAVKKITGETASSTVDSKTVPVLVSVGAKDDNGNVDVKASADLKALYAALIWD